MAREQEGATTRTVSPVRSLGGMRTFMFSKYEIWSVHPTRTTEQQETRSFNGRRVPPLLTQMSLYC